LLGAIIAYDLWRDRRFPRLRAFLLPGLLAVAYLSFNFHFYGSFFPRLPPPSLARGFQAYGDGGRVPFST
jgi:hypothetical protein